MRTLIHRMALAVASTLALAAPAAAQTQLPERLMRAEILRSGGQTLYDAIAATRPGWLAIAGEDLENPEAQARVVVYVDRRRVGDLRALRTIPAASVSQVRLRSERQVKAMDPQYPRTPFVAGMFVTTRAETAAATPRAVFSLTMGYPAGALPTHLREALRAEGFGGQPPERGSWFADPGEEHPLAVVGSLHYRVRGPVGVEAVGARMLDGWAGGYRDSGGAVSATLTSTEVAALVTWSQPMWRVGAGPAVRSTNARWVQGFCRCFEEEELRSSAFGVAGTGAVTVPARSRVFVEVRALVRYYPSETVGPYRDLPEIDVGGMVANMGLGLGVRF